MGVGAKLATSGPGGESEDYRWRRKPTFRPGRQEGPRQKEEKETEERFEKEKEGKLLKEKEEEEKKKEGGPSPSGGSGSSSSSDYPSSDSEESSGSGSSAYLPPLKRKLDKKPGSVLQLLLQQTQEQLGAIGEEVAPTGSLGGRKVLAYYNALLRNGVQPLSL